MSRRRDLEDRALLRGAPAPGISSRPSAPVEGLPGPVSSLATVKGGSVCHRGRGFVGLRIPNFELALGTVPSRCQHLRTRAWGDLYGFVTRYIYSLQKAYCGNHDVCLQSH